MKYLPTASEALNDSASPPSFIYGDATCAAFLIIATFAGSVGRYPIIFYSSRPLPLDIVPGDGDLLEEEP